MKKLYMPVFGLFLASVLPAQSPASWTIERGSEVPVIDGVADDPCWQSLPALDAFTTSTPVFGKAPHGGTEVRIFYTETALYLTASFSDPDKNGIRDDAGVRDGDRSGDWFQLSLDTWNDDQLAFDFTVSAAGVQYDARIGEVQWNADWQSAVVRRADGWTLELGIPFAALRFPAKSGQQWGLQLTRYDRSTGETSTWSPQNPVVQDRVIQFGTLEGLHDIRQLRRLQLGANMRAKLDWQNRPLAIGTPGATIGVDGRVGLSESATLDFTLLPPTEMAVNFRQLLRGRGISRGQNGDLPEPRQLIAEERDLFDKSLYLDYSPEVYGSYLQKGSALQNGERYESTGSDLIQATKLTARSPGNWRFGVYNALLGPVESKIQNYTTGETRNRVRQLLSDYNITSAEYLLRNNSFVRLSTTSLLAGPKYHEVLPLLDFQLRDRTNSYEISGTGRYRHNHLDTFNIESYDYGISLARVNHRWGWKLAYHEAYQEAIRSDLQNAWFGLTNAEVNYRDFRPRGPFLNRYATAGINWSFNRSVDFPTNTQVYLRLGAMDRHFQQIECTVYVQPYPSRRLFYSGGAYIYQKLAPSLGSELRFSSDQRKRFIVQASVFGRSSTAGDYPFLHITLTPVWVVNRRFSVQLNAEMREEFGNLTLLPASGEWLFDQQNDWGQTGHLGFNWYPYRGMRLYCLLGVSQYELKHKKVVSLQPDGTLLPVDHPLTPSYYSVSGSATIGFQYFFTAMSQLRFQHIFGTDESWYYTDPYDGRKHRRSDRTELTLIYWMDAGKRN